MATEYEWLDTNESPRRIVTVRDEVSGWAVSAIAVVAILLLFGI